MRNPIRLKNLRGRFLPLYVAGAAILLLHRPAPESLWAGAPLLLLGAAVRGWGAGHLVKNDDLTLTGPYAYVRHPLYLGTVLIGTGFAIVVGGWVGGAIAAAFWSWFVLRYFPRKESVESARLLERHGERFAAYRAAVPALRPRLRAWREGAAGAPGARWALARYSDNNELGTLLAVAAGWGVFWLRAVVGP